MPLAPPSPRPRRVSTPSWLDLRLVLGVVLVVGSVLLGAVVVARAHATRPVVTAAHELAAGTVLNTGDLAVVRVQLGDDAARRYAADPTALVGKRLQRAVGAGELVPTGAVASPPALTTLSITFATGDAPTLRAGERVELWVTGPHCASVVLLPDVTVQSASSLDAGFGSTADGQRIVISVPRADAGRVVAAQAIDQGRIRAGILTGAANAPAEAPGDLSACAEPTR
ncbi:MAG: SAF domain-containing protein [Jatrophihabitans sp.]|uniref:SAF domain-containing protein n=1 Tax=Jatrophihabitans sp. TaxID=1932789 RepID=UPI003F7CFE3D